MRVRTLVLTECRLLVRSGLLLAVVGAFIVISALALWSGRTQVARNTTAAQLVVARDSVFVDSLARAAQDYERRVAAGDTTVMATRNGVAVARRRAGPGAWVLAFEGRPAVLRSYPLAALALGVGGINASYPTVSFRTAAHALRDDAEIQNPSTLALGRFDLAFVVVYVMPLMMIALTYNIVSGEREIGTLDIAASQSVSLSRMTIVRALTRAFVVVGTMCAIVVLGGVGVASTVVNVETPALLMWSAIAMAYALFWCSLALLANAFIRTSAANALALAAAWMVFTFVVPSMAAAAARSLSALPSRAEEIARVREYTAVTNRDAGSVLAALYDKRPELRGTVDSTKPVNINYLNFVVARRVDTLLLPEQRRAEADWRQQQRMINMASFLSPPLLTARALMTLSGTDADREHRYGEALTRFQSAYHDFFLPRFFLLKDISTSDLQASPVFGLTGAGPRIRMRGLSSISLANDPIVYLDGVRVESSPASVAGGGVGGPAPNRLNDVNPDEVASIEIVRGPSAATFYGTDAANGVVLIQTKRGLAGAARWSSYVEGGAITQPTNRYPTAYYQWGHTSTGAATQCLLLTQAAGGCVPDSLSSVNVLTSAASTPFGTGQRWQIGTQVSGGTEALRYFLAAEREREVGTFSQSEAERLRIGAERGGAAIPYEQLHPNALERTSLRANIAATLSRQADILVSAGYVGSGVSLPPDGGSLIGPIYAGVNGRGYADQFGGWATYRPGDSFGQEWRQDLNRFTLSSTLNARPLAWLTGRATAGLDYVARVEDLLQRRDEGPNLSTFRNGRKEVTRAGQTLSTADASLVALQALGGGIVSRTTIGTQYTRNNAQQTRATASDLGPGGSTLDAGATRSSTELTTQSATLGAYVEQGLEFGDRLFFAAAVRGDDNSSFGRDYNAALYPKVSGSWVVSREGWLNGWRAVDMLRLRGAYGASGVQPGTRDALFAYRAFTSTVGGRDVNAVEVSSAGNPDLQPERTSEIEAGFEAALAGQRVRTEFTCTPAPARTRSFRFPCQRRQASLHPVWKIWVRYAIAVERPAWMSYWSRSERWLCRGSSAAPSTRTAFCRWATVWHPSLDRSTDRSWGTLSTASGCDQFWATTTRTETASLKSAKCR